MLVRGKRIDNPETAAAIRVPADAIQIEPLIVAPVLAAPMLLTFFLSVMLPKTRKRNEEEMFPVES
jgi:sortase A